MKKATQFLNRLQDLLDPEELCLFEESLLKLSSAKNRFLRLNPKKAKSYDTLQDEFDLEALSDQKSFVEVDSDFLKAWEGSISWGLGLGLIQEKLALTAISELKFAANSKVLDLCAAPGAKSTGVAERLGPDGWIVVNDPSYKRVQRASHLLSRHGIFNCSIYNQSALDFNSDDFGFFDLVIADVPCSGESLIYKRKDKRDDVSDKIVKNCAALQSQIIQKAGDLCAFNGQILYSTCAYNKSENEDIVKGFLEANPNFVLISERRMWPHIDGCPGGYFAVLKNANKVEGEDSSSAKKAVLNLTEMPKRKLLRHGPMLYDLSVDEEVCAFMSEADLCSLNSKIETNLISEINDEVVLEKSEAVNYLKGLSINLRPEITQRGFCRMVYAGYSLGYAKVIEDRINNKLPKQLRSSR